jgi:ribosome maturation factor RimP
MITTTMLTEALQRQLEGTPHFLVFAEVRPSGKAIVEVDNDKAITLKDLTVINKGLREAFGDALDDLELEVSSPGMGRPFKVQRQYQKHIGRMVEVLKADGTLLRAQLVGFSDTGIAVLLEQPSKVKGRPAKLDKDPVTIPFVDIKSTQASINFN